MTDTDESKTGAASNGAKSGAGDGPDGAEAGASPETGAAPSEGAGGEGDGQPAASSDTGVLSQRIKLLSAQLEESFARARDTQNKLKDEHERLLRTAAEFENYKRRAQKEKEDTRKFAVESLLKDFLPVADNLERAMDHADQHDPKHVIEGVRLVQKMLDAALARFGVSGFSALGQPFDPALHEALMQAESDAPPGTVVQEMARGYKLHERLVRPAAVVVAKPRAAAEAGQSPSDTPAPTAASDGAGGEGNDGGRSA